MTRLGQSLPTLTQIFVEDVFVQGVRGTFIVSGFITQQKALILDQS